jgi:predicted aspartyl protease
MKQFSGAYDNQNFDPPAPVVEIGVCRPGNSEPATTLIALIDSGADATMLPINAIRAAKARYLATRQMRTLAGQITVVETYLVTVTMGPFQFPGIEAIASAENGEAILGRDILNQLEVNLNGLASAVVVSE